MKILFMLKNTGMHDRLGVMTLSSILKQRGHSVYLLLTEDLNEEEYLARVKEIQPEVLAYSVMTGEHNYYVDLNRSVRSSYKCISVFGGPHPTFRPDLIEKPNVDAICRGEGDVYFPMLLERIEDAKDFYDVPNFWFKKSNGEVVKNGMGPLVENLDALPFPDRKLIYDIDPALRSRGSKVFMAMRGCPYQCTYCFNHIYNELTEGKGKVVRYRSVDNVIAEIKSVQERFFLDRVIFADDTFVLKPKNWLRNFAERYSLEVGLPLICTVRANLIDDEICVLLKRMKCINVYMGLECGNNAVANEVLKRHISNEQITEACTILHKHRIKILTQNLVGLPVDNPLEVDLETLDFNIKLKPHFAWSSILYPYPGTKIGQLAISKGMFDDDFEKTNVSNKTESALDFGDLMLKRKIVNLHKLFGIIVQFPFLRRLTPALISLPFTRFYTWVFFAFYGYKILVQSSFKGMLKASHFYITFYFKYVSRLEKRTVFKNSSYPALKDK
jgi:anaerobic magnesium-protoporphyrin IX monomethyl ester cyclase